MDDIDSETNGKEKFAAVVNCLQVIGFKPQVCFWQLKSVLLTRTITDAGFSQKPIL